MREAALDARALLRHQVAGLAFRFAHAVRDAPDDFATFEAGHEVRTPLTIVRHVAAVLEHGRRHLQGEDRTPRRRHEAAGQPDRATASWAAAGWAAAIDEGFVALEALDTVLTEKRAVRDEARLRSFVHGPLTDAATHVGQLAMLRRLAGSPVAPVSYYRADVRAGRIRPTDERDR